MYAYYFAILPLLAIMYLNASSISPPLQPWLPFAWEQSTRFCSLKLTSCPDLLNHCPSIEPVVENALIMYEVTKKIKTRKKQRNVKG